MADKYKVELNIPGGEDNNNNSATAFISSKDAGLIPRSVRLEIDIYICIYIKNTKI